MKQYKRPEKETDPAKAPGQIVNRPPTHVGTLKQEIEEFLDTEEIFTPFYQERSPDCRRKGCCYPYSEGGPCPQGVCYDGK